VENCETRTEGREAGSGVRALNAEQAALASQWFSYAMKKAAERCRGHDHRVAERCRDCATDALISASRRYDPSRNMPFPALLSMWLRHTLSDAITGKSGGIKGNPKCPWVPVDEYDVADHREPDLDAREQVEGLIARLPAVAQNYVEDYYLRGLSDQEIADSRGVNVNHVYHARTKAISYLREMNGTKGTHKRQRGKAREMAAAC
jgi:DNA-directed RNA polymerase specialized sigma24 family protein